MNHSKYLVTVDVISTHNTWEKIKTESFEGNNFESLKSLVEDVEYKWNNYRTCIKYYKQSVEMVPTLVATEIDCYGNTDKQREKLEKLERKEKYLKLKEEFGE